MKPDRVAESLAISKAEWKAELDEMTKFYEKLGSEVPDELVQQLNTMKEEFEFF